MSNQDVFRQIKHIYSPVTAFGNTELLKLFQKIKEPNENGEYEISGSPTVVRIVKLEWDCVECGAWNEIDNGEDDFRGSGQKIDAQCRRCEQKHKVEVE